ncbi:hypothetical protein SCA6_003709 [Theobroma cacao]
MLIRKMESKFSLRDKEKMPCKIGWRTARYAINWACCGSDKRVFVEYSSFSDIDLDDLPSKSPNNSSYPFNSARSRTSHRTNDSRRNWCSCCSYI